MKCKFVVLIAMLFIIVGCYSDDTDSSTETVNKSSVTITVPKSGVLNYTGEGEFEGVVLELNNSLLKNKKITIDKIDPPAESSGYLPLSKAYRISIEDDGVSVEVNFTFPYDTQLFKEANITESEIAVLTYVDGASSRNYTEVNENNTVRSVVYLPATIYAGYKKEVQLADKTKNLITLKYVSRDSSKKDGKYFIDPSGNYVYDTVRGISNVQLGEKIILSIDNRSLDSLIVDINWSLSKKPIGSTAEISVMFNDDAQIIPDKFGLYTVQAVVTLLDGKVIDESINLWGMGYAKDFGSNIIVCFDCHDGSYGSSFRDIYGRKVLRDIATHWKNSAHFKAFDNVSDETDPLCFQCHTTGYFFPDRNNDGSDDYPKVYGYDDLITDWDNPNMGEGNKHLRGVTCEACHGPTHIYEDGVETGYFAYHPASFSITSGVCLVCHDSEERVDGHIFKYKNIHERSHLVTESNIVDNKPCFDCHTGEGYLSKLNGVERSANDFYSINGIGCPVCHDPHGETGNKSQLRKAGSAILKLKNPNMTQYDMTINVNSAAMCYDCHSAGEPLPAIGKIPHNTQAEMLEGVGGYDYGKDIESSMHNILSNRCVDCHMREKVGDNLNVNHEFSMKESVDERLAYCNSSCHLRSNVPSDYDYEGKITEIKALLEQLKTEINLKAGLAADTGVAVSYSGYNLQPELIEALNKAAYNYHFIVNDRSFGAHNYFYAKGLIEASLNDLANF